MTDTNKNAMNAAIELLGHEWEATLADLTKQSWSKLIAALGFHENILTMLGFAAKLNPNESAPLRQAMTEHGEAFQAALMQHLGEVVIYAHEKISAEVDRRFSLIRINT